MTTVPVTDADREALEALRPFMAPLAPTASMLILEAIARARAEGAASEREACIKVIGGLYADCQCGNLDGDYVIAAIRARGEQEGK